MRSLLLIVCLCPILPVTPTVDLEPSCPNELPEVASCEKAEEYIRNEITVQLKTDGNQVSIGELDATELNESMCYHYVDRHVLFSQAASVCVGKDGYSRLPLVRTKNMAETIVKLMNRKGFRWGAWIGLLKPTEQGGWIRACDDKGNGPPIKGGIDWCGGYPKREHKKAVGRFSYNNKCIQDKSPTWTHSRYKYPFICESRKKVTETTSTSTAKLSTGSTQGPSGHTSQQGSTPSSVTREVTSAGSTQKSGTPAAKAPPSKAGGSKTVMIAIIAIVVVMTIVGGGMVVLIVINKKKIEEKQEELREQTAQQSLTTEGEAVEVTEVTEVSETEPTGTLQPVMIQLGGDVTCKKRKGCDCPICQARQQL